MRNLLLENIKERVKELKTESYSSDSIINSLKEKLIRATGDNLNIKKGAAVES